MDSPASFTYEYIPWRGISKETMAFFNVQTKVNANGEPVGIVFPYGKDGRKVRDLSAKQFRSEGNMRGPKVFGIEQFEPGSSKSVTITEGELDALSVYQMLGSRYPVVSVSSGATAGRDVAQEDTRSWLNSFERIYLCFDNDTTGKNALKEVARQFDFNKVYHVNLTNYKDANEYLTNDKVQDFKNLWYNAQRFLPEGIISSQSEFEKILDDEGVKKGIPYPFNRLQEMTYGLRTGEVVLVTALEGRGKTEVIRAIEYHLLKSTDDNIGIIHLEESKARTLKGLAGYELKTPVHLPDAGIDIKDVKNALRQLTTRSDRLHLYSHFGSDDPDTILDTIRFLVASCQCRWIFLDHITMVVSGLGDDDERKVLDYLSTRLAMMVEELDFGLVLVSHVNDDNKTRGSRNISKIADLWIHLDRNILANSPEEQNTTYLTVNKNRFGSRTGSAGTLQFDISTFMVTETDNVFNLPPESPSPSAPGVDAF